MDSQFLAAIKEHSDDASYRLVYADWLEDRGRSEEVLKWRTWDTYPLRKEDRLKLETDLKKANGRRRVRTLSLDNCLNCVQTALMKGWHAVGGGHVANAYGYPAGQTVCTAAVRTDGSVRVGVTVHNAQKGSSLTTQVTGLSSNAKSSAFKAWADQT